jgi:hypothetical protein
MSQLSAAAVNASSAVVDDALTATEQQDRPSTTSAELPLSVLFSNPQQARSFLLERLGAEHFQAAAAAGIIVVDDASSSATMTTTTTAPSSNRLPSATSSRRITFDTAQGLLLRNHEAESENFVGDAASSFRQDADKDSSLDFFTDLCSSRPSSSVDETQPTSAATKISVNRATAASTTSNVATGQSLLDGVTPGSWLFRRVSLAARGNDVIDKKSY